ncbi:MAG: SpoIIE family protein phosphatase [Actinomycetota bacterium]
MPAQRGGEAAYAAKAREHSRSDSEGRNALVDKADEFEILGAVADGITVQEPTGALAWANEAAARAMGFPSVAALMSTPISEVMRHFELFQESGEPFPIERLPGRRALAGVDEPGTVVGFRVVETGEMRWSIVKAKPVFDDDGRVKYAVNIFHDITDRKRADQQRLDLLEGERKARSQAESSRENLEFLAETSRVLGSSLDYRKTLSHVAQLAVPRMADWCVIDLIDEQPGLPQQLTVAHADPERVAMARELRRRYPPREGEGTARVIATGEPEIYHRIDDDMLRSSAQDEEHLALLQSLELRSAMVIPLTARGRTFGAITYVSCKPGKEYGPEDLVLAEDMAHRAAMAVDNARLFQEAQQAAERHRSLIQTVDAIVWEGDADTLRFTFVSQRARAMLGYPLSRWTSDPDFWSERVHADDRERVMQLYKDALETGQDQEIEYRAIAADGRELWLRDFVHVTKDVNGKPRALRGLTVDISGRKVVEMRLQESNARFAYLARTLQQSLLPPKLPTIPGIDMAARYRAAGKGNEVGGDFYDLFDTEAGEWAAVVGDVRGKGAKAAALTGLARHTIRAATMQGLSPEAVLSTLNAALRRHEEEAEESAQFCTVTYALMKESSEEARVRIVSGGHPLPLVLRADGTVEEVGVPGMLLGVVPDPELQEAEVVLNPGDSIMLYTDGVTDGRREGELFGEQRLQAVLGSCIGMTAEEIADLVERSVVDFWSDEPLDDIAILVLKVCPAR